MSERKLISTKTQYILACIPFFGFAIVALCGIYNFKYVKRKGFFYQAGYYLLVCMPLIIFMVISAFIMKALVDAQSDPNIIRVVAIVGAIGFFVLALLSAFYAIWLQNRLLKRLESKESEADMQ